MKQLGIHAGRHPDNTRVVHTQKLFESIAGGHAAQGSSGMAVGYLIPPVRPKKQAIPYPTSEKVRERDVVVVVIENGTRQYAQAM